MGLHFCLGGPRGGTCRFRSSRGAVAFTTLDQWYQVRLSSGEEGEAERGGRGVGGVFGVGGRRELFTLVTLVAVVTFGILVAACRFRSFNGPGTKF